MGAAVGNMAGMVLYGIAIDPMLKEEQRIIFQHNQNKRKLKETLVLLLTCAGRIVNAETDVSACGYEDEEENMFCQKCGNKIEDNAAFCPRCGAKQPAAHVREQTINNVAISAGKKADETVQSIKTATKVCSLLRENAPLCPEIQSFTIKEYRTSAVVVGKIYWYSIQVLNGQIGFNWYPVVPFILPAVFFILSVVLIVIKPVYGSVLMLLSGLSGIGVSVFGDKEKDLVLPFIRKALGQSKYTEQFQYIEIISYSIAVYAGFRMMLALLLE